MPLRWDLIHGMNLKYKKSWNSKKFWLKEEERRSHLWSLTFGSIWFKNGLWTWNVEKLERLRDFDKWRKKKIWRRNGKKSKGKLRKARGFRQEIIRS